MAHKALLFPEGQEVQPEAETSLLRALRGGWESWRVMMKVWLQYRQYA